MMHPGLCDKSSCILRRRWQVWSACSSFRLHDHPLERVRRTVIGHEVRRVTTARATRQVFMRMVTSWA